MDFKELTLADREWIEPLLRMSDFQSEEYSFTFSYIWRQVFGYTAGRMDGFFLLRAQREGRPPSYLYPAGSGDVKLVIDSLIDGARRDGHGFLFHAVLAEQVKLLEVLYPGRFHFMPLTDYYDYIYDAQSLITLSGKKLHAKRNHINRFIADNPDWSYEEITPANLPEVIAMSGAWMDEHAGTMDRTFLEESRSVSAAIQSFSDLRMDGGLVRAGGRVVAFSMGDRLNSNTYLVHIEKAFSEVQGAYAIINREFAARHCQGYQYINREDDSGQEGLRKAKQSYRPVYQVEKYAARLKD